MNIAYLECATGISGDMTLAALLDAGVDEAAVRRGIESLQLPGVLLHVSDVLKGCFRARSIRIEHPEQHAHRHLSDIAAMIERATSLTPRARQLSLDIFRAVAEAEARVHGASVERIHFHEVGAVDSIVDIVGSAIGFDLLNADQVVCGPLPTGRGEVRIDHGLCPIPTPGTAELLKGIPLRDLPINAELTTPTGAAIVRVLADRFGPLPEMAVERIGCGAGTMDLPDRANILRLFVGQAVRAIGADEIALLETNLDDVTSEVIGYTKQKLLATGALDVYSIPIQMKKDRPGIILSVIARPADVAAIEDILFRETGTLGVRRQLLQRSVRARQVHTILTALGPVTGMVAWQTNGVPEFSPEFEACARIARETGRPLREVYRAALAAFEQSQPEHQPASAAAVSGGPTSRSHGQSHDHDHGQAHDHDHGH